MPETRLLSLQVENLGPIKQAHLDFADGLTVLTGETGAGKTLLVGALNLCAGESDDRGLRHSGSLAVSTVFLTGEREVSLGRRDDGSSRLRSYLDGAVTSATALRTASNELVSIYGQSSSQRLRSTTEFTRLVDQFGGIDASSLRHAKAALVDVHHERSALGGDEQSREREMEYLRARLAEIERVSPTSATELDEVQERIKSGVLLQGHQAAITAAADLLDGDEAPTVASLLTDAIRGLPGEGALRDVVDRLHALRVDATDLAQTLGTLKPGAAPDGAELAVLDARAADLHQLARTFGGTLESALQERLRIQQDLERLESSGARSRDIADRVSELETVIAVESARLRRERDAAAQEFTTAVQSHFASVALPRATLSASVEGEDGSAISLLFSSDSRRAPGPLQQLASGGELARVLLAISLESVSTNVVAVFDEIDAGIGGTVAEQIGACLRHLSEHQQVIVVTHLASVAALADRHFVVEGVSETRSEAAVREVTGEDRVGEIARMLAGESAPAAARALAEQLLAPSRP